MVVKSKIVKTKNVYSVSCYIIILRSFVYFGKNVQKIIFDASSSRLLLNCCMVFIYVFFNVGILIYTNSISGRSLRNIFIFSGVKSLRNHVNDNGAFRINLINAFCGI